MLEKLSQALIALDDAHCVAITARLLRQGEEPTRILAVCESALTAIGEKYAAGEYYIAGLIMAGELMRRISEAVMPHLSHSQGGGGRGRVLIGTVEGDIHDLGKNIAGALIKAHGFEVHDLGVDVSAADFVRGCEDFQPDVVGISVLLTSCFSALAETVAGLRAFRGKEPRPHIFISGSPIHEAHARRFAADFSIVTAVDTLRLCERLLPAPNSH